ncbi:hypothetical protein NEAUS03_0647 [Nematocida ausubeli]|nr:hypothetical protein NEAUS03_0647 [Nematocida ausubeli]
MECMYNKRFFAPQIDTEYSLEEDRCWLGIKPIYRYTRNRQMDKAYEAKLTNKMDEYTKQYHTHLIQLFPSPTGDITIETRGNQSFVQFLRAKDTEKHSLKILAMLLLFSEGVSIPIDVNNTVLKVYEKDKKDKIYFEVDMAIPWLNIKENKEETFQQKKVKQMIKFFQKYATNLEVLKMMVDKCTKEEVMSGKFLDSPKFLIQSYIFGFIGTAERAIEFIQTVHTMTEKYASKTKAPSKGDSVYDRLFKPVEIAKNTNSIALLKETEKIMNMHKVFPFANKTQLPPYTSVPWRDPITKEFSTNHLEDYSNCVECMILSLFCCLAYDPNDFTYKTDHMGDVSPSLKEFFSPENQPFDTTKAEFQKRWCTVVACLNEPKIEYCRKRNELDCGLINMLLVITEVVNAPREEKDKIISFLESLKEKKGELDYILSKDIEEYTKELLKRLSKTENVEIKFSELKSDLYSNGRYDISGKITVIFEKNSAQNTIVLEISYGHSNIEMQPTVMKFMDTRIDKMAEIASSHKNETTFVENLLAIYIEYEIRKIDTRGNNKAFIKAQVRKTIENDFKDINRLLLVRKIDVLAYKIDLFTCLIVYSMDQNLSKDHPMVHFTSNILGSTELNNLNIQLRMFPPIILTGEHDKNGNNLNYPKIQLFEESYASNKRYIGDDYLVKYVLDCDVSIFIMWIKFCIENFDTSSGYGVYELFDSAVTEPIYEYMFRDENMKYVDAVNKAIEKNYPAEKDKIINYLHNVWLIHLIAQENLNLDLIKTNFHAIHSPIYVLSSFIYNRRNHIIQTLKNLKSQLCHDECSTMKFNDLMCVYLQLIRTRY